MATVGGTEAFADLEDIGRAKWDELAAQEARPAVELVMVWRRALDGDPTALAQVAKWGKGWRIRASYQGRLADRYADALEKFERAEADLARAQNRWQSARSRLRRYAKQLDKLHAEGPKDG